EMGGLKKFKDMGVGKRMVWYYLVRLVLMVIEREKGRFLWVVQRSGFEILFIVVVIEGFCFLLYYWQEKKM
ncbi:DUF2232 domain-containing protein, partial [Bacillus sp. WP8]|uniref:DUF2232 domain-containing protein n=1 Tax=Bacillus sp. WP8 TaxID=756828 RepID=UPI0011A9C9C7